MEENLEKSINILGTKYVLEFVPIISREEFLVGQIDYVNQKIQLLEDLGEDVVKVTLFHEILHGIFNQLGFSEEETNEHLIQSLATALYQVLKENKLLG